MIKTIVLDGKKFKLTSSLLTIIIYRNEFGTDLFEDVNKIEATIEDGKVTSFKSVDILFHLIYALHKPFFGEDKTYEDFMGMLDFKVLSNVEELNRAADVIGRMLGDAKNNGNPNNFIPKK